MRKLGLVAIGFVLSGMPNHASAANYELGTPTAMSCTGILQMNKFHGGASYNLEPVKGYPNHHKEDPEREAWDGYTDMLCSAPLATTALPSVDLPLGKEAVKQILRGCSVGKICDITGLVNGMSHDVFFWVTIYTVNPTIRTKEEE